MAVVGMSSLAHII